MRLALPSLVVFFYIATSLIAFMPWRLPVTVIAGGVLLVVCLKYLIYEQIGGSFIAPDLPRALLLSLEVLYASAVILFFLLLIKDGAALVLWLSRWMGTSWRLPFSTTHRGAGIIAAAVLMALFGAWQSMSVPKVRTVEIRISKLPAYLDGFSIVQLSDLHIGMLLTKDWLQRVVEKTNALFPDVVALTGDMIDGFPEKLEGEMAPLGRLQARYGVYGVTGNHEYYFGAEKWIAAFTDLGIVMLDNEHRTLPVPDGDGLVIAGIPDPTEKWFGGPGPDIQKALKGAPDATRVLLAHRPGGIDGHSPVDVQLSGHTHGGLLLFLKPILASFNGGFVGGLYEVSGTKLYVSPGTGLWSGFSCRLGVPSEITRIVLSSHENHFHPGNKYRKQPIATTSGKT